VIRNAEKSCIYNKRAIAAICVKGIEKVLILIIILNSLNNLYQLNWLGIKL